MLAALLLSSRGGFVSALRGPAMQAESVPDLRGTSELRTQSRPTEVTPVYDIVLNYAPGEELEARHVSLSELEEAAEPTKGAKHAAPAGKGKGAHGKGAHVEHDEEPKPPSWLQGMITWRVCLAATGAMTIVFLIFEAVHKSLLYEEWAVGKPTAHEETVQSVPTLQNIALAKEYFAGPGRVYGIVMLVFIGAVAVVGVYFAYLVNALVAVYWDALQDKDIPVFWQALACFVAISVVGILANAYRSYLGRCLHIHWREALSRRCWRAWLMNSAHFQAGRKYIENPDQRIQVDVDRYVGITMGILTEVVQVFGSLFVFLPLLFRMSPDMPGLPTGWLCYAAIAYAMVGSILIQVVGGRIATLNYAFERAGADFRSDLVTVRDHSEAVALFGAEEAEMRILDNTFSHLRGIFWEISFLSRRLRFFEDFFFYVSDVGPVFVLSPAYFSGALSMGQLFQCRHALSVVLGAFSFFVSAYVSLAEWTMVATRLAEIDRVRQAREEFLASQPPDDRLDGLSAKALTLYAGEKLLLEGAELSVPAGKWAVLTGPEGSGKTTLTRALKGLWPVQRGLIGPKPTQRVLFLPAARSTGLRHGTLLEAAAYPDRVHSKPKGLKLGPQTPLLGDAAGLSEAELRDALEVVGLGHFLSFADEKRDWGRELSSGEMQRLLLARAVALKPDVLVLDEPVAHCAEGAATQDLFRRVKSALPSPTVLTVTHDLEIKQFHDVHIVIDPKTKTLVTT